ncbi:MAG TPA: class I SAM-dependent methyltransferase [Clostridia bacterium]|nr:class I SAM-dependent methyltransferase [Clostridia bacterium]
MNTSPESNWNTFARVNASQRWRKPSAAMGKQVTETLVAEARVEPGMEVLDIASGTGEPAISIATLLQQSSTQGSPGRVVATDISPDPLKVAEQRARDRGLTNMEFTPADVHQLPFEDGRFDRVTCRLGVMFFADLPRALREIRRVLKPNGRVTLLAWGPLEQPYFGVTIGAIVRAAPGLAVPTSGEKMFKFGEPGTLTKALREAGFGHVDEVTKDVPWNWPDTPEEFWAYFQEVTIPFKPLFQAIPPERHDDVHRQVLAAIRNVYDGLEVKFNARVVLASATPSLQG